MKKRSTHGKSRRKIAFAVLSSVFTAGTAIGPVPSVSAAISGESITACEITTLNSVGQPSGTTVVNVPPGDLGTFWDVEYSFTQGASLYLGQSFAYLISTDPAGSVSTALTVTPAPSYMIGNGNIATTAYSLKWYAYDDTAPNYSGPVLCQINVPAAGDGGDGGDGDGGISLDIDLSHYFTKAESSLPDTL